MDATDLKYKTTAQLKSKLVINKITLLTFIVCLTFFTGLSIYGFITKENITPFVALFAITCTSFSFLPLPFNAIKEIKTEQKSRNNLNS